MQTLYLLLSILPLALLLVLLLFVRMDAGKAALIAFGAAVLLALLVFGADLPLIATESLKGVWSAVSILIVVWPAILLYEITRKANVYGSICAGLQKVLKDKLLQVLVIGWVFSSFLQGVTGFGVPVSVVSPILISLGIHPVASVIMALLGQSWGNTFGTLAGAWLAILQQVSLEEPEMLQTAFLASLMLFVLQFFIGGCICLMYGGLRALRHGLPAVVIFSVVMGGGELLLSQTNQILCCFIPACVCLAAAFPVGKLPMYRKDSADISCRVAAPPKERAENAGGAANKTGFHTAFFPYYLLVALCVLVLLIQPIYNVLNVPAVSFSFPETHTSLGAETAAVKAYSPIHLFTNSGIFLLAASAGGALLYWRKGLLKKGSLSAIAKGTKTKCLPISAAIILLVALSQIMSAAGMVNYIAEGITAAVGGFFSLIAPFMGMLGTFITGSNVSSNVLFCKLHAQIGEALDLSVPLLLAAQTAGGAVGSLISPSKIILGTTTAGISGQENQIYRRAMPFTLLMCALFSVITYVLS